MKSNEHGFSVVELLASLSVLAIIGVIVWGVFFQGYDFSKKSISKNAMQQEANLIIEFLKKVHQTSEEYIIKNSEGKVEVSYTKGDSDTETEIFEYLPHRIEITYPGQSDPPQEIEPNKQDIHLTVKISNNKNEVAIDTILYRLKGDENGEEDE